MARGIGHHQYVIIENWQYEVAVRLVVVVRTTAVHPGVTGAVLRYRCLLPFRSDHFFRRSCVAASLVII